MTERLFLAGVLQETNIFSPIPTTLDSFTLFWRGGTTEPPDDLDLLGYGGALKAGKAAGMECVTSLFASATPAAPMPQPDWARLRDMILADLRDALPVDMVFLFLHGAQAAADLPDCEGDLIEAVRQIVGATVPIVVELDLHANLSMRMAQAATVIVACKHYPHTDFAEVGGQAIERFGPASKSLPVMEIARVPLVAIAPTTASPIAAFVDDLLATEALPGILAASALYGFFGADGPETGAAIIVVTDGDQHLADRHALRLAEHLARAVRAVPLTGLTVDAAILAALAEPGLAIIADRADNPGGGAAGDSTCLLAALLDRNIDHVVLGMICDPRTVDQAHRAGLGASIDVELGGKMGPLSGAPVIARARVRGIADDIRQRWFGTGPATRPIGRSAALTVGGVTVIVAERREQVFSREVFTGHGIDLAEQRLIVVKSTQHFHLDFAPLGRVIYCDAPGTVTSDLRSLPYRHLDRPLFPLDDDPIVPVLWQGKQRS